MFSSMLPKLQPHLEQLPVEVQMSILYHLGTMEAVLTLLRASPRFLYVYRTNRDVIYPKIVCGRVPLSAIIVGLSALNLRNLGLAADITTFTKALSTNIDQLMISLADWKYLYQTYCAVDDMIYDSVRRSFRIIQRDSPSISSDSFSMPLSRTVYTRLLRGFYNWEILTSIGNHYIDRVLPPKRYSIFRPDSPDLPQHLECFQSFCKALTPHEFEEISFVAYYLRKRIYELLDQAEDDYFEAWKAMGSYKYRHDFDDEPILAWGRETYQDIWAGNTIYSKSLAAISQILHESQPSERIKQVEEIDTDFECDLEAPWKRLADTLKHQRTITVANLTSPLLPQGWHSGRLPKLDWVNLEFTDTVEHCNLRLLWECRSPLSERPDIESLEGMSIWGAVLWDVERLRRMDVLMKWPEDIAFKEYNELMRHFRYDEDLPRRNSSGIDSRVAQLEDEWVSQGLMSGEWDYGSGCDRFGNPLFYVDDSYVDKSYSNHERSSIDIVADEYRQKIVRINFDTSRATSDFETRLQFWSS